MLILYVSCNGNKHILSQSLMAIKSFVKQYDDVKTNTLYIKNILYEDIFIYFNSNNLLRDLPKNKCMHHYYTFARSNGFPTDITEYWFTIDTCALCINDEEKKITAPSQSSTYIGYRSFKASLQYTGNIFDFIKEFVIYKIDEKNITYNTLYININGVYYLFEQNVVSVLITKLIKMQNSISILN